MHSFLSSIFVLFKAAFSDTACMQAKAALPMLKARSSGGRQTRSRTAKLTPKRASTASKPESKAAVDNGKSVCQTCSSSYSAIMLTNTADCMHCCDLLGHVMLKHEGYCWPAIMLHFEAKQGQQLPASMSLQGCYAMHDLLGGCRYLACDVLYTDLMSPMSPDDNTNRLMLKSAAQ